MLPWLGCRAVAVLADTVMKRVCLLFAKGELRKSLFAEHPHSVLFAHRAHADENVIDRKAVQVGTP